MGTDSVAKSATGRFRSAYRSELAKSGFLMSWPTVLAAGLVLSACSAGAPLRSGDQTRMVPLEQAVALPDVGGPAVTAVLETRYANAIQQDVLLATSASNSGQNMLRVQLFGPVETQRAGGGKLRAGFLPAKNIHAEMREQMPGVRMEVSNFYVQNRYGAFAYAVGRTKTGTTCFYGWQRITSTGYAQTWIGNKGSIQVRLRLCDDNASEARLLQAMYGFSINASFNDTNWNPYGVPLPPDETLGRPGAPMYPVSAARFETVEKPVADAEPAPPRRPKPRRQQASTPAPPQLPAPTGPLVPPPPGEVASSTSAGSAQSPAGRVGAIPPPPVN